MIRKARVLARRAAWAVRLSPRPPLLDQRPPRPPRHWLVAPPDFVGVGVQKAGTSWWYSLIAQHPDVYSDARLHKETHYFDRFWRGDFTDREAAEYARFFPRPPGMLRGEWTPRYLTDHWVPGQLAQAAPAAAILVMLRDPIERYKSGVTHTFAKGGSDAPSIAGESFHRGFYASHLAALFRHLDPQRVLVLQYEGCRRDPLPALRRTYAFLGLTPDFVPRDLTRSVNATSVPKLSLTPALHEELVARYAGDVIQLMRLIPECDVSLWPNFAHLSGKGASAQSPSMNRPLP